MGRDNKESSSYHFFWRSPLVLGQATGQNILYFLVNHAGKKSVKISQQPNCVAPNSGIKINTETEQRRSP
jgi:hypothetical protein